MLFPPPVLPGRFEIRVRHDATEGVFIAEAITIGSPGPFAGGRGKSEAEARARLDHALDEMARYVREALAELDALPAETAQRVAVAFTRHAAMAMSGQPMAAAGFDPRDAPAFHRMWRALPGWAKVAFMAGMAHVAVGGLQKAGADLVDALKNEIRSIATQASPAEREPTPAPPLPPLVGPRDAEPEDAQDEGRNVCGADDEG